MKRASSTVLILTSGRIARAEFDAADTLQVWKTKSTSTNLSPVEALRAALAVGGKARGRVWVLTEHAWMQKISVSPAQIAGLSVDQLKRALSFEAEPFSGIPVAESVIGYHQNQDGEFTVVELSRMDFDAIQRAVETQGGTLAGITHPGTIPDKEEAFRQWACDFMPRLREGTLPLITPPPPAPSPRRFLVAGIALETAALLILSASATWTAVQRKGYERRLTEFSVAGRDLEAANKSVEAVREQMKSLEGEQDQRERVFARRGALYALMDGLARICPEDVVLQSIEADGPSSLIVSGVSLEASAVDELSIVLTQNLRTFGWTAQPRRKTGKKALPSGGPWEFSLSVTIDETAHKPSLQISQTIK